MTHAPDEDPTTDVTLLDTVLATADATREAGRALAARLRAGDVVVLVGELGAGKTTLTQGLAEGLDVRGPITSPTFVISRVHPSLGDGPALVHVDAYRLHGAAELEDIDLDATVATSVTVVEWGSGVAEQLSDSWLAVELVRSLGDEVASGDASGDADADLPMDGDADLAMDGDDPRRVRVVAHGPRWRDEPALQFPHT